MEPAITISRKSTKGIKFRRFVIHSAIPQPNGKILRHTKITTAINEKDISNIIGISRINKARTANITYSIYHTLP